MSSTQILVSVVLTPQIEVRKKEPPMPEARATPASEIAGEKSVGALSTLTVIEEDTCGDSGAWSLPTRMTSRVCSPSA